MQIGILKEIKSTEQRVIVVPQAINALAEAGHDIFVESDAGKSSNFENVEYESAGAKILPTSEKIFQKAQLLLKVQAPQPIEYELFSPDHISFSFLLLPNNPERISALLKRNSIFFAIEMIESFDKKRPVLNVMSEIAGKHSIIQGAKYLEKSYGGKGIQVSGIRNVPPATITILGAGVAGSFAARQALALGANVNLLDEDYNKLIKIQEKGQLPNLKIFQYSNEILQKLLKDTDILIAAVLKSGYKSPVLVKKEDVKLLKPGSVIVDLSIDQGGCVETSRPTTQENPIYIQDEIVYYCVTNIPSSVPYTSSIALSTSVLPYVKQFADLGFQESIAINSELRNGLNLYRGKVVNPVIAKTQGYEYYDILELLELNI